MLVNSKFRPPIEKIESPIIKKTFDYYKATGNLWNSKYLSSPKISQYYHDQQETFLTGPNSPYNISLAESTEKSKKYSEKASAHKKASQELLHRRKVERIHIQAICNQLRENRTEALTSQKRLNPDASSVSPGNAWNRLNSLPACRLRNVIPEQVIGKDLDGIENIMQKTQEIGKLKNYQDSVKAGKNLQTRLAVVTRHNQLKQLEKKCGIEKIRDKSLPEGPFGYVKFHKTSKRTEELSKPHTASKGNRFDHQDFRGLLHADYSEAVTRIEKAEKKQSRSFQKSWTIQDTMGILESEVKEKEINLSKESSIEVTGYDLVHEFFS